MNAKFSLQSILLAVLFADFSSCRSSNQVTSMQVQKAVKEYEINPDVIHTIPKNIVHVSRIPRDLMIRLLNRFCSNSLYQLALHRYHTGMWR